MVCKHSGVVKDLPQKVRNFDNTKFATMQRKWQNTRIHKVKIIKIFLENTNILTEIPQPCILYNFYPNNTAKYGPQNEFMTKHRTIPYHTIPYHTIPYHTIPATPLADSWLAASVLAQRDRQAGQGGGHRARAEVGVLDQLPHPPDPQHLHLHRGRLQDHLLEELPTT